MQVQGKSLDELAGTEQPKQVASPQTITFMNCYAIPSQGVQQGWGLSGVWDKEFAEAWLARAALVRGMK